MEDEREASVLLTRGGLGLPETKTLTEAEREQRCGLKQKRVKTCKKFTSTVITTK
jgi:hypothetical protein